MQFLYQGFTHTGDTRRFTFQRKDERNLETTFSIDVNLLLFARHKIAMQDAPAFCLQLLTNTSESCPDELLKLQQYEVLESDLLPLLMERRRRADIKLHKAPPRRFVRKPSLSSQFHPAVRPGV